MCNAVLHCEQSVELDVSYEILLGLILHDISDTNKFVIVAQYEMRIKLSYLIVLLYFKLSAVEYPSTSVSLPLTPAQKEKKR